MRYPAGFLEEIRSRLPASSVIGRKVKLRKAGREWSGLSPFKTEKTASFFVNDQKARWFDFAAGKNGDIFSFLTETEGLSFTEAVERLAGQAGLPLPKPDAESVKREAHKLSLIEVNQYALDFFRRSLARLPSDHPANGWLRERALDASSQAEFSIGYAPGEGERSLKEALARDGIEVGAAIEAGLVVPPADIRPIARDRFRARVVFPIFDQKGRPIAFGGRALGADQKPKYLNSPETPIFDKGRVLYNADKAREPAHNEAPLVVVEGYTATTSSVRAGFPATVAPMGTALTPHHLESLWRMSDEPIICFDGDDAGVKARRRAIETALPMLLPGRSIRFASMPPGVDPDEMVRQRGAEAYQAVVKGAASMIDTLWRLETAGRSLDTPEARAGLEAELIEAVQKIPDPDLRNAYRDDMRDRIRALSKRTRVYRSNGRSNHSTSPGAIRLAHGYSRDSMSLRDATMIVACVAAPRAAVDAVERLAGDESLSGEARAAVGAIVDVLAAIEPDAAPDAICAAVRASSAGGQFDWALRSLHGVGIVSLDPGVGASAAEAILIGEGHA